nr:aminotransferase class I/II-fold pyridoxal phosphate-dependent enzyme [Geosporobacter ferrireducens]
MYHLNIGQPDIETPENFMNAVRKFDDKVLKYSFSQGMPELVDAMIKYYKKYNMAFEKDEILIMNGGSEALLFALIAIADDGDEVIVPEPFYTNYNGFGSAVGVNVVPITTEASKGFHLPAKEEIIKAINSKSRAILLSNPGNPTGLLFIQKKKFKCLQILQRNTIFM